jgi:glycosyltransferase involved in cell wall biosynthesis
VSAEKSILHCIATLEGGGAERHLSYLAAALAGRGWAVEVALLRLGPNSDRLRSAGVPLRRLGHQGSYDPRSFLKLRTLIRRTQPGIVHTWLPLMTVAGGLAAISNRIPWVVSEQGSGQLEAAGPKHRLRMKLVGAKADAIVANSNAGKEFWDRRARRSAKTFLVPNGLPLEELAASPAAPRHAMGIGVKGPVILYAGRLEPSKDVRTLIQALPGVFALHPRAVCVICGDGSERRRLQDDVRGAGLETRVVFAGYVDPLAPWLKTADVFVSPSLSEGQPNAVLEAMACGAPLVVSDIPAHREFLDETCAILVPTGAPLALSDALAKALTDRDSATGRASSAEERAGRFTLESMASSYETVYAQILEGTPAQPHQRSLANP